MVRREKTKRPRKRANNQIHVSIFFSSCNGLPLIQIICSASSQLTYCSALLWKPLRPSFGFFLLQPLFEPPPVRRQPVGGQPSQAAAAAGKF